MNLPTIFGLAHAVLQYSLKRSMSYTFKSGTAFLLSSFSSAKMRFNSNLQSAVMSDRLSIHSIRLIALFRRPQKAR